MFTGCTSAKFNMLTINDVEEIFDDCHLLVDQLIFSELVLFKVRAAITAARKKEKAINQSIVIQKVPCLV